MNIDEKNAIYLKNGLTANKMSMNLEEIFHIYTGLSLRPGGRGIPPPIIT